MKTLHDKIDELLTTGAVAHRLGRSSEAIRGYVRANKLPAQRTQNGQRIFKASDVEQLANLLGAKK